MIARSALLIDALSTISVSSDEDAMLSRLAGALRWLIGFTRLDLAKTTDEGHHCRVRTLFGAHSDLSEPWEESLTTTSRSAGAFLASGRSWLVSNDTRHPPRSTLAIALEADDHVYGALIFETSDPVGFHAQEIDAARIVGQHLGVALAGSAITLQLRAEVERRTTLEVELRRTAASAEAANRAKDNFLAMISHELRSPLNTIVGWVAILRSGQLPADQMATLVDSLERNVRLQTRLVNDLIDASRIAAGKLQLMPSDFDLRSAVIDAFDAYRGAAEAGGLTLTMEIPQETVPYVGDAQRLQQVFGNLLSNAIKFTTRGRGVKIWMERMDTLVRIRVRDEGQGIESDFLPHIFEPFRQADGTPTRTLDGLGLGLAIARHITELHNGTVVAESAGPGLGVLVTVELPLP